jgi:FdhD protein
MEIRIIANGLSASPGTSVAITMRTPGHDFELAAGFLHSEGFVRNRDDIVDIAHCVDPDTPQERNVVTVTFAPGVDFDPARLERNFFANSSCGVCGKATLDSLELSGHSAIQSDLSMTNNVIRSLPDVMRTQQRSFELTGGIHAAGLFRSDGTLVTLREDIGRHNTVDKLVGDRLISGDLPLNDYALLVSGRAGFEILQKALVARVPIVAAVGAPSTLAADLAAEFGITLVGFLTEHGFNVYSHPRRIAN